MTEQPVITLAGVQKLAQWLFEKYGPVYDEAFPGPAGVNDVPYDWEADAIEIMGMMAADLEAQL